MDGFYTGQLVCAPIPTGDGLIPHRAMPGVALGTAPGDLPGSDTVWVRFGADTDPVGYLLVAGDVLPAEPTATRLRPPWMLVPGDVIRLADGTTRMVTGVIERGVMADRTYVIRLDGGGHCEVAPGAQWVTQVLTWAVPRIPPGRDASDRAGVSATA